MLLTTEQVPSTNVIVSPPVISSSSESSGPPTTQGTPEENVNPAGSNIVQTRSRRPVKPPEFFGYEGKYIVKGRDVMYIVTFIM